MNHLGVNNWNDEEWEKILTAEEQDSESVLHLKKWPMLRADWVAEVLENKNGRTDEERNDPDHKVDASNHTVSGLVVGGGSGDGEPSVHGDCSDGSGRYKHIGALHRWNKLASNKAKEPLASVETLGQGWRETYDAS